MLVDYFKALAAKYNSENKCGFCWEFGAPLSESALNKQLPVNERQCCANMFLTEYSFSSYFKYSDVTHLNNYEACDHRFKLYVVVQKEDIGQNTYNEIPDHPVTESLWTEVYKPLLECMGCDKALYQCELGYDFDILSWDMDMVKFKEDRNLTGWVIKGRVRVGNIDRNRAGVIKP